MKTFEFTNNTSCFFDVGHYPKNANAISIGIVDSDSEETIVSATDYLEIDYEIGQAVIKNYSAYGNDVTSNVGMTEFLKNLGIVEDVIESNFVENDERKTVDVCKINLRILKEYSKYWDYWAWNEFED